MQLDYTDEQKQLRKQLREYFTQLMTPERKHAIRNGQEESGPAYKELIRQIGKDGWLSLGFPKEYGGQGKGTVEQLMFFEEALMAGAPLPFVTINTVAPALMEYGTEEQKQKFLAGIISGEIHFAIGYSEPAAGTDLAVLNTMAVEDGDYYVINGTKVYTSSAEGADYIWLATRTTPDVKHKGVTMFIVDAKDPGFSVAPIHTFGGMRTNMTYYTNVRVHKSMMIGQLNQGWGLIMAQLNHERVGLAAWGIHGWRLYSEALAWARKVQPNGQRAIDEPYVQQNLAEVYSRLEAQRLMNARMAYELDQNRLSPALASAVKVFSTEAIIEVVRLLMECVGPESMIDNTSEGAVLRGELEREYRRCQINTFGGGVNEIQRGIVANFGLMMPRHR
jgi:3-oxocholest-4-en-26-oyl-CoA dehydrogenase alpha subunit